MPGIYSAQRKQVDFMNDALSKAREMVLQYARHVESKNVEAILDALARDAWIDNIPASALAGHDEIRRFYEARFAEGDYEFDLDITDQKAVSDVYFLQGTMQRQFTPVGNSSGSTNQATMVKHKYHFSLVLKREGGELKIWQIRIVPDD